MIVLEQDPSTGLALIAGRIACGQIEVRHAELPPLPVRPPALVDVLRAPNGGMALVNPRPLTEEELVLDSADQAIEGEIQGGRLEGVVCDKRITLKVHAPYEGPVLALVPVRKIGRIPREAFRLITYRIALP